MPDKRRVFLDWLSVTLGARNDAHLGRLLGFMPPAISNYRSGKLPLQNTFWLKAHAATGYPVELLKRIAADPAKAASMSAFYRLAKEADRYAYYPGNLSRTFILDTAHDHGIITKPEAVILFVQCLLKKMLATKTRL